MSKTLKLNALQGRTLALLQELAVDEELATDHPEGGRTIHAVPEPHGNHVHIGRLTVSSRFASGLMNENVWKALERKALVTGHFPYQITLLPAGIEHETGIREKMLEESDH